MAFLRSRSAAVAVVLAVAALVLFFRLGSYALWDPDEGRHAEIAREVLASPDWAGWVTPRLNDEPYREKPIFFYWATAAAYAAVGVTELGARLVSASAAFATVLAVVAWSVPRWGARSAALAGVVLVTTVQFAGLGRFANLDMLFTCFVTVGVLALERWGATARLAWLVAAAAAAGFGTLTKGLAAPVLIGGIGTIHLIVRHGATWIRPRPLALAALVAVAIALPWHLAAARLDPEYLRQLYLEGHLGRFAGSERTLHHEPFWFYVPILLGGFFPWSALLPATLAAALGRDRRDPDVVLCLVWAGVVFVFFSASASKLATYVLPCMPPLALLTGRFLDRVLDPLATTDRERRLLRVGLWIVVAALLIAPIVVVVLGYRAWDGALWRTSLLALGLLPLGAAVAWTLRADRLARAVTILGAGFVVVLCAFYALAAPPMSRLLSAAPLAETIVRTVPAHASVPVIAYAIRAPSLMFYLRRPIIHLARWRPVRKIVQAEPLVLVVTSPKHRQTIVGSGVTHPWQTGSRRELWGSQPPPP